MAAVASLSVSVAVHAQMVVKKQAATTVNAAALTPAQLSLDAWIVSRYKSAELLPDSGKGAASAMARAGAPRVDGARTAERRDTLVAVHFDTTFWRSSLTAGANVRFADPSGAVTQIAGRVTARRAFRAPRKPGARAGNPDDWRIGWAYLVAIPARTASAASSGFNGWSIVDMPSLAKNTAH